MITRERKKQKEREDAWAKIEALAAKNAETAAIPVQILPIRNVVKSSIICWLGIAADTVEKVEEEAEDMMEDLEEETSPTDLEEDDSLTKELVSMINKATIWRTTPTIKVP